MDISDLKKLKKEAGLTNAEIAELSGIPVSTVNKIFSGANEESPLWHPARDRAGAYDKGKDSIYL